MTNMPATIAMMSVGLFNVVEPTAHAQAMPNADDMQRDLELLAAIGASDQRSLRAVALSRQIASLDHYRVLELPRAATRAHVVAAAESMKGRYNPTSYPPIVRESVQMIIRRIDEALHVLTDPVRRAAYDKLLAQGGGPGAGEELQKRLAQRSIAEQNFNKARDLSVAGDYYGAIVLLKQAVAFAPDHAEAWYLLGACQERNPKWRREAAQSFQRTLAIDPNHVDALISLGDVYRSEGLTSRAQSCYEDVLKIESDNQQAKSRLAAFKR